VNALHKNINIYNLNGLNSEVHLTSEFKIT
jgi:hypothetical protein